MAGRGRKINPKNDQSNLFRKLTRLLSGPIVNYITGKGAARCKIPVVIVPGNLTDAQIEALC